MAGKTSKAARQFIGSRKHLRLRVLTDAARQMLIFLTLNYGQLGLDFAFLGAFALIFASVDIFL